jgi:hypothetical protein
MSEPFIKWYWSEFENFWKSGSQTNILEPEKKNNLYRVKYYDLPVMLIPPLLDVVCYFLCATIVLVCVWMFWL